MAQAMGIAFGIFIMRNYHRISSMFTNMYDAIRTDQRAAAKDDKERASLYQLVRHLNGQYGPA